MLEAVQARCVTRNRQRLEEEEGGMREHGGDRASESGGDQGVTKRPPAQPRRAG